MQTIISQAPVGLLVESAIKENGARLSASGALVVSSGAHTGRAANDKYVVLDEKSRETINWQNNIKSLTPDQFARMESWFKSRLASYPKIYQQKNSVGADSRYSMNIHLTTTCAYHALFSNHMFRPLLAQASMKTSIYHLPFEGIEAEAYGCQSPTVVALNLTTNTILIAGTAYCGEIKKAVFSLMNYILPEMGVMPMHSGAHVNHLGESALFFGLSGTGKTTLSTDTGARLIGDDEIGMTREGIFNFEGGCYAKTYQLSAEREPEITQASLRFGAILENIKLDDQTRQCLFDDKSITENGRSSYPLSYLPETVPDSKGPAPKNIFFLAADAFGVLPALSKLNHEQAIYYFLSGYTAKLAGTEVGVIEPQATFSTCFGAPFMMRPIHDYSRLLASYLNQHKIQVWLVNTGWVRGPYGVGQRFPLAITRGLLRTVASHGDTNFSYETDEFFGFSRVSQAPGIEAQWLNPRLSEKKSSDYTERAKKLLSLFEANAKKLGIQFFN